MINAALVGLGWWGRHIVGSLRDSDKIRIVRAIDIDAEASADFAARHGIPLTADFQDGLDDAEIEAVILATPHSLHEAQILRVAAAGKHVFCEKPLVLAKAGAERVIAACRTAGLVLGVGHERRFEPALIEIKRMIDAGELGTILHVESNFSHDKLADMAADDWRASTVEAPAAGMTAMGVHQTDLYVDMFGEITEVYAQTARRVVASQSGDVIGVQFRFASGATGYLNAILATPLFMRYQVFGADAWVEARNATHHDTPGVSRLTVCRKGGEPETTTYAWTDAVKANFEAFADAVTGVAPYPNTDEQKLHAIAVLEAIFESVATEAVVGLR